MTLPEDNYKNVFDHPIGFGKNPAVLVIDFVRAYTTEGSPLYASAVLPAVLKTQVLLASARRSGIPVIFTQVLYNRNLLDGGLFVRKVPVLQQMIAGNPWVEIVPELMVRPEDTLISKQYASAFFGTSLMPLLHAQAIDTLLIAGCSTSGCVRATAVDGMQHGLRVVVPRECVADRHPAPHESNLFDINAKYGDVLSLSEVIERLETGSRVL